MKRILSLFLILLSTLLLVTAWWLWQDMQLQLDIPSNIKISLSYTIQPNMNLKDISHDLTLKKILEHPYYFMLAGRLQGDQSRIKAGEYLILPDTTPRQLLAQFVAGKVKLHSLTLVEGWSYRQVMQAIDNNDTLIKILPNSVDSKTIMTALGYPGIHAEGRFFPDTYYFPSGTTDLKFLRRAYIKMLHVLEEEWQGREQDIPYKTPDEALIMASIIEKEVGVAEERAAIAGVFVRRLRKGIRLQTDPTVIYAMGDSYQGNIRRKDLKIDSPYNTYRHKGLPPTPIALAGREAIYAALHPQQDDTLYFVAKGDRTHYFSKTLEEHNRAVNKYQR